MDLMKLVFVYSVGDEGCGWKDIVICFETFKNKDAFFDYFKTKLKMSILNGNRWIELFEEEDTYLFDIMEWDLFDQIKDNPEMVEALTFKDFSYELLKLNEWFDKNKKGIK